jgi:hypothetical protein
MVAITAEYPIDSPARQLARRSSPNMPVNVSALVKKAYLGSADRIAALEEREHVDLAASAGRS